MDEEKTIYEIMLELAEEENTDLRKDNEYLSREITILHGYIAYLEKQNEVLVNNINSFTDIKRRRN